MDNNTISNNTIVIFLQVNCNNFTTILLNIIIMIIIITKIILCIGPLNVSLHLRMRLHKSFMAINLYLILP